MLRLHCDCCEYSEPITEEDVISLRLPVGWYRMFLRKDDWPVPKIELSDEDLERMGLNPDLVEADEKPAPEKAEQKTCPLKPGEELLDDASWVVCPNHKVPMPENLEAYRLRIPKAECWMLDKRPSGSSIRKIWAARMTRKPIEGVVTS